MLIQETQPDRASQSASCADTTVKTVVLRLAGHVQGVGFRPFVYQLAQHHELCGSVQNQLGEVEVIAQGDAGSLFEFEKNLIDQAPPLSKPHSRSCQAQISQMHKFSFHPITSPARIACERCRIPTTGVTATPLSTAHNAARVIR